MSYCRWGNDGFSSDLYIFRDEDGYTTMVAKYRYTDKVVGIDSIVKDKLTNVHLTNSDVIPIGLKLDGQNFHDKTLEQLLERITNLRSIGYKVPEQAFERIRREINEQKTS